MAKPVVVIIGRPNVGKSTLFNRIVGTRAAIVEDLPGVTRDRNYMDAEWEGKSFVVVDTGGFFPEHEDRIFTQMKEQALFAIDEADLIIHLMDGKEGVNPHDADIAKVLRASGKEVLWVVNKIDTGAREDRLADFFTLGVEELLPVSAATGYNFDEVMDAVAARLPAAQAEAKEYPRVAVIGRPNVGKSTLVNALLGKERMLVSPVAGTTRDAIDSLCKYYGREYLLIDTAGIRRKDRYGYSIERFAMVRALKSIERADVTVLLMDASEGIVSEDIKIAGLVHKYNKGLILLMNKWDLVEEPEKRYKKLEKAVQKKLWFFSHAPMITISGIEKKRITKLFPVIDEVLRERKKRVPTAELNRFAPEVRIPPYKGRQVKIFYITQVRTAPPTFAIFTNIPEGIKENHVRHIEGKLRERYSFRGTPIRIFIRKKG